MTNTTEIPTLSAEMTKVCTTMAARYARLERKYDDALIDGDHRLIDPWPIRDVAFSINKETPGFLALFDRKVKDYRGILYDLAKIDGGLEQAQAMFAEKED